MKFNTTLDKLTGIPDPSGWVQLHDFMPVNQELVNKKGHLLALISMTRTNPIIGKEIFTRLQEIYFAKDGNPFEILAKSVEEVHKVFTSPTDSLSLLSAVFLDGGIYLAGVGKMECWVVRNNKLARIINSGEEVRHTSGSLQTFDKFFFGTTSFFAKVTPDILRSNEPLTSVISSPQGNVGGIILTLKGNGTSDPSPSPYATPNVNIRPMPGMPQSSSLQISPIRLALANLIDKILLILPQKKMFIKDDLGEVQLNKKRKVATLAGGVLLTLLIMSIFFAVRQQKKSLTESSYMGVLNTVQHDLDEAQSLVSVDGGRARSLVLDANTQIQSLNLQKINDDRLTKLRADVATAMGQIAGLYNDTPTMYLDLTLISSGFKGDDMAASDNRMVVLDKAGKRLESIDIDTSKANPVAGPDIMPDASKVAAYSDRNFVSASDGIWGIGDQAQRLIKSTWGTNILISAYTGNFYLLDQNNSAVWRFQGNGGTFGSEVNWFGPGIKPDLSGVVAWTIDGNIWMLTDSGQILRFSAGSPIDFSLKNPDMTLKAVDIFTTQDSSYLYILDSGNGRVLVVDKQGNFKAQYVADNIKNAKKIVVSESSKKMILLEGDKLYSLDIKHLN